MSFKWFFTIGKIEKETMGTQEGKTQQKDVIEETIYCWDLFPGDPVVVTLVTPHCQCRGPAFDSWSRS